METDTQSQLGKQTSETLLEEPDWWASGKDARSVTEVNAPPVVIYPSWEPSGSLLLPATVMATGATAMLMSALPWVTANSLHHYAKIAGTTEFMTKLVGSNGWLTFTGGATLVFMGVLMLASRALAVRIISALLAATTAGIAGYDIVTLSQKIHTATHSGTGLLATRLSGHLHLGYGIIVVLCVAFAALLASIIEAVRRA